MPASDPDLEVVCRQTAAGDRIISTSSNATFLDALIVPDLALACAHALDRNGYRDSPGDGLKKLRLLSQCVREAAQRSVQGFTLLLGDEAQLNTPRLVEFLRHSQLLALRVNAVPPVKRAAEVVRSSWSAPLRTKTTPAQRKAAQLKAAQAHTAAISKYTPPKPADIAPPPPVVKPTPTAAEIAAQLSAFITGAGHALSSVTHLTLTLPHALAGPDDATPNADNIGVASNAMLLPLVNACPRLQTLTVTGSIGSSVLCLFGSSCPKLACLEAALQDLSPNTLEQLATLLPNMTSLTALESTSNSSSFTRHSTFSTQSVLSAEKAICVALKACPGLHSFDMGRASIREDVWNALPSGLCKLSCNPQAAWQLVQQDPWRVNASLRRLQLHGYHSFDITQLSSLLTAAPGVDVLNVPGCTTLNAVFSRNDAQGLQILGERLDAGLVMSSAKVEQSGVATTSEFALVFTGWSGKRDDADESSDGYETEMTYFLQEFTQPLAIVTELSFLNEDGYVQDGSFVRLPILFPIVEKLTVNNFDLTDLAYRQRGMKHIDALAACKRLREVKLKTVAGVNVEALHRLCKTCKTLRLLRLSGLRGVSIKEGRAIKRGDPGGPPGIMSGVAVTIERGYVLGAEDRKMNCLRRDSEEERSNSESEDD